MSRHTKSKPPLWPLLLALMAVPAWVAGMHWHTTHYSGWSEITRIHGQSLRHLPIAESAVIVVVVKPDGTRFPFARDVDSGAYRRGLMELGYDRQGFWMRASYYGWLGGPRGGIYVPWADVRRCENLRVRFKMLDLALIVQSQGFLDTCESMTG